MSSMKLVAVKLPEPWLREIDELVKEKMYPNRAECIRIAIRDFLHYERGKRIFYAKSTTPT